MLIILVTRPPMLPTGEGSEGASPLSREFHQALCQIISRHHYISYFPPHFCILLYCLLSFAFAILFWHTHDLTTLTLFYFCCYFTSFISIYHVKSIFFICIRHFQSFCRRLLGCAKVRDGKSVLEEGI